MDDAAFQAFAERIVPLAQETGVAAIIGGDSRIAGRVAPTASMSRAARKRSPT